ncbi:MAG: antitoxin VapB family protein [Candidatus Hydrothermarchaeota archaeon]|nr:antitoxin VapB family protein [Candidatus Hydrothermarchaeota archaeon]
MTAKTITIRDEVYGMLMSIKRKDESFSRLFERLVKSRSNITVLKELHSSVKFEKKAALLKEIYEKRRERRH